MVMTQASRQIHYASWDGTLTGMSGILAGVSGTPAVFFDLFCLSNLCVISVVPRQPPPPAFEWVYM